MPRTRTRPLDVSVAADRSRGAGFGVCAGWFGEAIEGMGGRDLSPDDVPAMHPRGAERAVDLMTLEGPPGGWA